VLYRDSVCAAITPACLALYVHQLEFEDLLPSQSLEYTVINDLILGCSRHHAVDFSLGLLQSGFSCRKGSFQYQKVL